MKNILILKDYKGNEAEIRFRYRGVKENYYRVYYKNKPKFMVMITKEVIKFLRNKKFKEEEIDKLKEWIIIDRL